MSSLTPQQQAIANRIYASARQGNSVNDGLPETLSQLLVDQSAHETDGWTSNFFKSYNACFGYSCDTGSKWQSGCSSGNADNGVKVGAYQSIEDSTQEVVDWIYRRRKEGKFPDLNTITTSDQYAQLLKNCGYYGASLSVYLNGLKRWASEIGSAFRKH